VKTNFAYICIQSGNSLFMKAPLLKTRFFKLKSARQFDYIPMYYDADKERMEERKARIAKELELSNESMSREALSLRMKFDKNHARRQSARRETWSSVRLIVILLILIFVCYKIFINLEGVIAVL
jgi:hypothetical protein